MNLDIKTYDWMPKDEFAFVKPGLAFVATNKKTGKKAQYIVKQPQIVRVKLAPQ